MNKRQARGLPYAVAVLVLTLTTAAFGQTTINVGSSSDFYNAIQTIDAHPNTSYSLNIVSGFTMGQQSSVITSNSTITIVGNSNTIDGANLFQPLTLNSGSVTLQGLNVINTNQPIAVNGASSSLIGTTGSLQGAINSSGLVEFAQATSGTYSGILSGTGGVEINGTGAITFSGANNYSGGTYVTSGSSLIGTTTSLQGNFINFGSMKFNQSTGGTYSGAIGGLGGVEISGAGPVTFTGLNSYTGGTVVDLGSTLIGTTGSLQGAINDSGAVKFNQVTSGTYAGNIFGTGRVEIGGNGPVTFSGSNSYTGGTTVDAGSTLIGTANSLQGAITNNGFIQFNQPQASTYTGNMTGTGHVEINGPGAVILTGLNSYSGGTTVDSGSALTGTTAGLQGSIVNNGFLQFNSNAHGTFVGNISGTGRVEIASNASVTLSGFNSYSGGTTVDSGGTLNATTLNLGGAVVNNGLVTFHQTGTLPANFDSTPFSQGNFQLTLPQIVDAYSGNMSGTGRVEITGSGITRFTGANSYTGGTTVDAGNLLLGYPGSIQGNITNNGWVQFGIALPPDPPNSVTFGQYLTTTYAGNISGSGGVIVQGPAPFAFSGTNSYTGGTTVADGSILIGTTNGLQGAFTNNGHVQFTQDAAGIYSGNMTGAGVVVINGSGPVTFSGTNSYTGGTEVLGGSTLIGTTNSLQGPISTNGHVEFSQTTGGTYAGVISGLGSVEIGGVGPITLSGVNTYTGGTTVDNGSTLFVTGSITGNLNVNNGGTFMGTGSVGSTTVHAGGTLFPGTVGAPLTINGNLTQSTGSALTVEINSTSSDKVIVNGTAQIGAGTTLNLNLDPGILNVGKKYEVLTSTGALTGKFSSVLTAPTHTDSELTGTAMLSNPPVPSIQNIVFSEQYNPNSLQLTVNSNLSPLAQTSNQLSVASVIDQTSGTATGAYANAITQLTTLGPSQLSGALNQLSGSIYPSIGAVERQTATVQMQLLSTRLASLTSPGIPSPNVAQRMKGIRLVSSQGRSGPPADFASDVAHRQSQSWTSWAQGYGLGGNLAGDGNAGGVNYRLGGTLFGIERWLGENTMVGVLGGYTGTSINARQDGSSAQINSYQVGLYELYHQDAMYVSNIDAFGNNSASISRPLNFGAIQQTATGSSNGNQWAHYTELGKTFDFDEIRLQPFMGLQYMYLDQSGDSESGAGSLDLTTGHQIVNSVRSSFGARLYQETMWGHILVIPSLSARYQHEWGNGTQLISSSFSGAPTAQFTTSGSQIGRDFGLFTLSATAYVTERFSVYGTIDAQVASRYNALIGSGGLQYSW